MKDHMTANEVIALRYVIQNTTVPTSNIVGVWQSIEYPGDYLAIIKRVPGKPIYKAWPTLSKEQKQAISTEIQKHIQSLRNLPQPEHLRGRLCSISEEAVSDESLSLFEPKGPFETVNELIDYLVEPSVICCSEDIVKEQRAILSSSSNIVFTHGDLNPTNIMVHFHKGRCTVSFIDWACSSWMPLYWDAFDAADVDDDDTPDGWEEFVATSIGIFPRQSAVMYQIRRLGCTR